MGKVLKTLQGEIFEKPPIWLMRQAGRYLPEYRALRSQMRDFMDLCYSPEAAAEVTLQPIRRFGFDASIIFSDILVIPDALGQKVWFEAGEGPKLASLNWEIITSLKKLNGYLWEKELNYLDPVFQALKIVRKELPVDTDLIGFAGTPWTIATYMIEEGKSKNFEKILKFSNTDGPQFLDLLDILSDFISAYLIKKIESGANILQLFDSWAQVVPPTQIQDFLFNPVKKITSKVWARFPEVPIIYYGKGVSHHYHEIKKLLDNNGNLAFGVDQGVTLNKFKHLQELGTVQGNLDPELLVKGGEECFKTAQEIVTTMSKKPFIFNLGHGILPNTPIAHVERLLEIVRS